MIRKLRFKLISAAMISLFIVITIIIGIVNILNYHGIVQDADGILTILQDNNGRFPQQNTQTDITKQSPEATAPVFSPDGPGSESDSIENASGVTQAEPPKGNNNPRLQSPELPYESRFFSVLLDENGTVLSTDTGKIAAVNSSEAGEYAKEILQSGKRTGFSVLIVIFGQKQTVTATPASFSWIAAEALTVFAMSCLSAAAYPALD